MATLEEVYNAVISDEEQRKAFAQASGDGQALSAFLKERGCDATSEQVRAFLAAKLAEAGELSTDELMGVSGGGLCGNPRTFCPECKSEDIYEQDDSNLCCRSCGHVFCKVIFPSILVPSF